MTYPLHELLAAANHLVAADYAARDSPPLRHRIRTAIMPLLADLLADAAIAANAAAKPPSKPHANQPKPHPPHRTARNR